MFVASKNVYSAVKPSSVSTQRSQKQGEKIYFHASSNNNQRYGSSETEEIGHCYIQINDMNESERNKCPFKKPTDFGIFSSDPAKVISEYLTVDNLKSFLKCNKYLYKIKTSRICDTIFKDFAEKLASTPLGHFLLTSSNDEEQVVPVSSNEAEIASKINLLLKNEHLKPVIDFLRNKSLLEIINKTEYLIKNSETQYLIEELNSKHDIDSSLCSIFSVCSIPGFVFNAIDSNDGVHMTALLSNVVSIMASSAAWFYATIPVNSANRMPGEGVWFPAACLSQAVTIFCNSVVVNRSSKTKDLDVLALIFTIVGLTAFTSNMVLKRKSNNVLKQYYKEVSDRFPEMNQSFLDLPYANKLVLKDQITRFFKLLDEVKKSSPVERGAVAV